MRFFFGGERPHLQGLEECLHGFVVAPHRPQAQSDLHMGVPGILRVAGHVLELFARLVEHLGVLEHTTAFIVVKCGLRLFHARILRSSRLCIGDTQILDEQLSKNEAPRVGPSWSHKSITCPGPLAALWDGRFQQAGRKGTRDGRQHVRCEMALYKPYHYFWTGPWIRQNPSEIDLSAFDHERDF